MSAIGTCARKARQALADRYRNRVEINTTLNRSLVSYQSNRNRPIYRWFKYKEGFSAALVEYVVARSGLRGGRLLDPFAGTGAALLFGREVGFDTFGIELMPVGVRVIEAYRAAETVDPARFARECRAFENGRWQVAVDSECAFPHLAITAGAFPEANEHQLNQFRTYLAHAPLADDVRLLLDLACLSVLETISYTRKDGQYLRWDHRAPRQLKGKEFHKGPIPGFGEAMQRQLRMMERDLTAPRLFPRDVESHQRRLDIQQGSCLEMLQTLADNSFDLVVTSPPYCNRYDYTRTYALELAYLGIDEERLKELRQALLSCTVENRSKRDQLRHLYCGRGCGQRFDRAIRAFEKQEGLQEVLGCLDQLGRAGKLNNPNVPRMVRNYFLESTLVIYELARLVRSGGFVIMVNDNVQYGGEEVPVDLILSDIAASAGFEVRAIWVLPRGKGNSSQQMGRHGRRELRKCVYVWQR